MNKKTKIIAIIALIIVGISTTFVIIKGNEMNKVSEADNVVDIIEEKKDEEIGKELSLGDMARFTLHTIEFCLL